MMRWRMRRRDGPTRDAVTHLEEVTALDHEVLDDPVENAVLVPHRMPRLPVLPRAELPKVLTRLRRDVGEELHLYPPDVHAPDRDVEEHDGIVHVLRSQVPHHGRHRVCEGSLARDAPPFSLP